MTAHPNDLRFSGELRYQYFDVAGVAIGCWNRKPSAPPAEAALLSIREVWITRQIGEVALIERAKISLRLPCVLCSKPTTDDFQECAACQSERSFERREREAR